MFLSSVFAIFVYYLTSMPFFALFFQTAYSTIGGAVSWIFLVTFSKRVRRLM